MRLFGGCALASVLAVTTASAAPLDPAFTEQVVQTGLPKVTGMGWAPDGTDRLFVITKDGEIRIIEAGVLLPTPFATMTPIRTSSECGLIGLAFHPSFTSNGYVYVFVTVSLTEQRILRFTADGNVGQDEQVVVANLPTRALNHNGGGLGIGPDGKLYWSIGDNGNLTGVDADLSTLAAKVSRANLDGSAPSDNPFYDGDGPNNDYIWAQGFRNPFTLTFQPSTERVWVNTVGTVYEQVFTPQAGDNAGYNKYESNQIAGFLAPTLAYRTRLADMRTVTTSVRAAGVATYTTPGIHRFRTGAKVTITGVADTSFNVVGFITAVPTPYTFTLAQPGPDADSTGGAITGPEFGAAVTGGAFWDSSGAPASHVGDFFVGDYVSGKIMRAELGEGIQVETFDEWANTVPAPIDIDVGPDGDLYFIGHAGELYRTSHDFTSQAIIVSKLHLRTFEGGSIAFNVRLAIEPTADHTVSITRASGDDDIVIGEGESLTFTTSNWATPQRVLIQAENDQDLADDETLFEVSATGLPTQSVRVRATDQGASAPGAGGAGSGEGGAVSEGGTNGEPQGGATTGEGGQPSVDGGAPGATGAASTGGAADGGAQASDDAGNANDDGCGCRLVAPKTEGATTWGLTLLLAGFALRRRLVSRPGS